MKLFPLAYANAAVVGPMLWVGARLCLLRKSTPVTARSLVTAEIIPFPKCKARAQTSGSR